MSLVDVIFFMPSLRSDVRALQRVKRRLIALKAGAMRQFNSRKLPPRDNRQYLHHADAYYRAIQMVEEEIRLRS